MMKKTDHSLFSKITIALLGVLTVTTLSCNRKTAISLQGQKSPTPVLNTTVSTKTTKSESFSPSELVFNYAAFTDTDR